MRVFFVLFCAFEIFGRLLVLPPTSRTLPPARQRREKPQGDTPKAGYAVGEETRTEAGPHSSRTARRHDPGHATTPGSTASSPGRRSGGPATIRPRQQDRPTARHGPSEPGQRTPRPDARRQPTRRPGRPQEPPRAALLLYTPISSDRPPHAHSAPRWTHGPAADHQRRPAAAPARSPPGRRRPSEN